MTVRLLPAAQSDLAEVVAYCERQQPGLGVDFASEFANTLDKMAKFPDAGTLFAEKNRLCHIRGFPYGVLYRVLQGTVVVGAVMHLHRAPDAWLGRLLPEG